jgi:hypothetical protein
MEGCELVKTGNLCTLVHIFKILEKPIFCKSKKLRNTGGYEYCPRLLQVQNNCLQALVIVLQVVLAQFAGLHFIWWIFL